MNNEEAMRVATICGLSISTVNEDSDRGQLVVRFEWSEEGIGKFTLRMIRLALGREPEIKSIGKEIMYVV